VISCPKCDSMFIRGPRYCDGRHLGCGLNDCSVPTILQEHLMYRCDRCGYAESSPTRDSAAPATPAEGGG
jgi:hypothetical protein